MVATAQEASNGKIPRYDQAPVAGRARLLVFIVGLVVVAGLAVAVGLDAGLLAVALPMGILGLVAIGYAFWHWPIKTVLWFWVFLLFQDSIATEFGKTSSIGHLIAQVENPVLLLLFLMSILRFARNRPRGRLYIYIPALGYFICGVLAFLTAHVAPKSALIGTLLECKMWVAFVITLLLPWRPGDVDRVLRFVVRFAVPVAVLTFADLFFPSTFRSLLNLPRDSSVRLGIESARSIFPNPALLASFMFLSFAPLISRFVFRKRRTDLLYMGLFAVAAMLSLRFKAILGIVASFLTVMAIMPRSLGRKLGPALLALAVIAIPMAAIAAGITNRQVTTYSSTETPRNRLLDVSLRIANDRFPIGVGFGRYGSAASSPPYPYSPVYDKYGLSSVPGLSRDKPDFIHDTSWPTVIGETGVAGWGFMAGGLFVLVLVMMRRAQLFDQDPDTQMAALAALTTLIAFLFDTAGRPALFDAFTVLSVGLFLGPALAIGVLPRREPGEAGEPHAAGEAPEPAGLAP